MMLHGKGPLLVVLVAGVVVCVVGPLLAAWLAERHERSIHHREKGWRE